MLYCLMKGCALLPICNDRRSSPGKLDMPAAGTLSRKDWRKMFKRYADPNAGKYRNGIHIGERLNWGFVAAERYYKSNGNLNVLARYVDKKGYPLYQWLCDTRQ